MVTKIIKYPRPQGKIIIDIITLHAKIDVRCNTVQLSFITETVHTRMANVGRMVNYNLILKSKVCILFNTLTGFFKADWRYSLFRFTFFVSSYLRLFTAWRDCLESSPKLLLSSPGTNGLRTRLFLARNLIARLLKFHFFLFAGNDARQVAEIVCRSAVCI